MGKTKKQRLVGETFLRGLLVAFGVYLVGHLTLAGLCLRGSVGEESASAVTAVLCALSALAGGLLVARRCLWGPLAGGVLLSLVFGAAVLLIGLGFWGAVDWSGSAVTLLGCDLGGGVAAGLLCARRPKARRRKAL